MRRVVTFAETAAIRSASKLWAILTKRAAAKLGRLLVFMKRLFGYHQVDMREIVPYTFLLLLMWLSASSGYVSGQATPSPTPRARVIVTTPTATPSPSPTSTSAPTPTPKVFQIQTLDHLQSKIRQRMFALDVRRGRIGIKIVSLASSKVVFENDSEKYFMPASNQKNFTVATAFERLGPEFRFITSVYSASRPDESGAIRGDLRIFGRGDVSVSTAFFGTSPDDPSTYYKGLDRLAERIAAAGVKRIEGSIVADESYFRGFYIPDTWEWDDLQNYYGAEISALPLNDNAVDLAVRPGAVGTPCVVTISPPNTLFQINNTCTTTNSSSPRSLSVTKRIDRNVLDISGTMSVSDSVSRQSVTVTKPAELFAAILKQRLDAAGITVAGGSRVLPPNMKAENGDVEIARLESVPFRDIAARTMKPSQNMFTETILWTLGEEVGRKRGESGTSAQLGLKVMREFVASIGIPNDGILPYDGSGMSRHNLITPAAVAALYTYMAKESKNAKDWRDSLTIGGIDGTLRNRFRGTAAEANMRGKTGTIDQVSALSGYVKTAAGEELVVSLVVNGVAVVGQRTALIDDIIVTLANFNGKID